MYLFGLQPQVKITENIFDLSLEFELEFLWDQPADSCST
jgi:hypothetical protein